VRLPVVAENAVQDLEGEVQPPAVFFHPLQEPDALDAVEEWPNTVLFAEAGEDAFAVMAERGVADVVAQSNGLDEVLVEAKIPADGAGYLGKQLDVEHPMADVLVFYEIKDLGLVNVTRVGPGMEDTIRVHREILAVAFLDALFKAASDGLGAPGGIGGEAHFLLPVELLA